MSPIFADEYEKLTDWQKAKFHELTFWQNKGVKGSGTDDMGCAKILEWVKRMEEPPPLPPEDEPTQE